LLCSFGKDLYLWFCKIFVVFDRFGTSDGTIPSCWFCHLHLPISRTRGHWPVVWVALASQGCSHGVLCSRQLTLAFKIVGTLCGPLCGFLQSSEGC
jgi:hypothetical protein